MPCRIRPPQSQKNRYRPNEPTPQNLSEHRRLKIPAPVQHHPKFWQAWLPWWFFREYQQRQAPIYSLINAPPATADLRSKEGFDRGYIPRQDYHDSWRYLLDRCPQWVNRSADSPLSG